MATGEALPLPTWMSAGELAKYEREMAILAADPRTANGANRPAWLVRQVIVDATSKLLAKRDDLQGKIASIESGLRYYDRSQKPSETGEDKLPAWRTELETVTAQLLALSGTVRS